MVEKNVSCAGRIDPQCGTNNAAARHVRFDDVGFEILVEVVPDAGRPELDGVEQLFFAQIHEGAGKFQQIAQVFGLH